MGGGFFGPACAEEGKRGRIKGLGFLLGRRRRRRRSEDFVGEKEENFLFLRL